MHAFEVSEPQTEVGRATMGSSDPCFFVHLNLMDKLMYLLDIHNYNR